MRTVSISVKIVSLVSASSKARITGPPLVTSRIAGRFPPARKAVPASNSDTEPCDKMTDEPGIVAEPDLK
jgi:hypothetical protein